MLKVSNKGVTCVLDEDEGAIKFSMRGVECRADPATVYETVGTIIGAFETIRVQLESVLLEGGLK